MRRCVPIPVEDDDPRVAGRLGKGDSTAKYRGKYPQSTGENVLDISGESGIIKEKDVQIMKSVGAAAHRDEVKLPNGQKGKIAKDSKITKIYTFAGKGTGKPVKVAKYLSKQYEGVPEADWKKFVAMAMLSIQTERLNTRSCTGLRANKRDGLR